jgi:peroxiredoxin
MAVQVFRFKVQGHEAALEEDRADAGGDSHDRMEDMTRHDPEVLPVGLPVPEDDGACDHLPGMALPAIALEATDGEDVDLSRPGAGRTVVYAYPRTGRPGVPPPDGWDLIPGARGCTPQSCAFRDHYRALEAAGLRLFGLSTQEPEYQREMAGRLHLPFAVLSDAELRLTRALDLPTFKVDGEVDGAVLIKRLTLVIRDGRVEHVFYPVFPPDAHAEAVLDWAGRNPL